MDYQYRKYHEMYGAYTDMTTGHVSDSTGHSYDLTLVKNTPDARRSY